MPGTPLSAKKIELVPKINVVLPSWKLTCDEYYDPDNTLHGQEGFHVLEVKEGF